MFVSQHGETATYLSEGSDREAGDTNHHPREGKAVLELRPTGGLTAPVRGSGEVAHLGESSKIIFELRRVNEKLLRKLSLPFDLHAPRRAEDDEEEKLVRAALQYPSFVDLIVERRDPMSGASAP